VSLERRGAVIVALCCFAIACSNNRGDHAPRVLTSDCRAPVLYVALGDSTVEGVAATSPRANYVNRLYDRLRAVYPAARVENLGVSGAVSADVVAKQLPRVLSLAPDLVTLSVGPNDITDGVVIEEYEKNIDRILSSLTEQTHAVVVVNLIPDLAVTPRFARSDKRDLVGRLTVRFNDALKTKAREYDVPLVDLYSRSRDEVPKRPELVAADGYHPSDLGYARWAELMWTRVEPSVAHC
jgi:acyl-CoA thioesterase I